MHRPGIKIRVWLTYLVPVWRQSKINAYNISVNTGDHTTSISWLSAFLCVTKTVPDQSGQTLALPPRAGDAIHPALWRSGPRD